MAGICCYGSPHPTLVYSLNSDFQKKRVHGLRCRSTAPNNSNNNKSKKPNPNPTPQILKIAVNGLTELLRIFSSKQGLDTENYVQKNAVLISNIDDVVMILKLDYENSYFVTGTQLYSRNLKLLVPFFDSPSIVLQKIEKGCNSETSFVSATWKLRTFLRLPWRPLILVNGSTVYDLDDNFKIVRHAESWDISALEAIGQIFTPSFLAHWE